MMKTALQTVVKNTRNSYLRSIFFLLFSAVTIQHFSKILLGSNSEPSFSVLFGIYVGVLMLSISISILAYPSRSILTTIEGDKDKIFYKDVFERGVKTVLVAIFEETCFRIIPYIIMVLVISNINGQIATFSYYLIGFVSTVAWIELHSKRRIIVTPFAVLLGYFLIHGLIVECILIHVMHNLIMYSTVLLYIRPKSKLTDT